ncbi:MAG: DNA polymerase III subunit alpha [Candidatus Saccharibacteria bacterium]|nr:DNA polymerase III subunit alpha [Candidatus Saccharibacteria bacterium]MCY4088874.1 DNA polymerase III subunit alpha [Candidatus Saccharibacteria bacterium]
MPTKASAKQLQSNQLKQSDFVHLHVHSHYSLLDGLSKIPDLVQQAKESGMTALALTDHGTLSGAIEFYQQATEQGIKPIIGLEAYLAKDSHLSRTGGADNFTHLILLAQNNQGYKNLMKLSTISYLEGFYYKPRIDKDLLQQYQEGLIVLSGCLGGEIGQALQANRLSEAEEIAQWYKSVFGDRFYLEIQDHSHTQSIQKTVNEQIIKLSDKLGIEVVLTGDSHYLKPEDAEAHEVLLCIQTKHFIDDPRRMSLKGWDLYLSSSQEMIERWQNICPQAILNTKKIADQCQVDIKFDQILLPKFQAPNSLSAYQYLEKLVFEGLNIHYAGLTQSEVSQMTKTNLKKNLDQEVIDRAEYELKVIKKLDYASYFLIVWDFCRWGRDNKILFGPGRGSAAGSLVSFALQITTIDPLKYGLLFERFLNDQRIAMPDIDIDIEDSRRDEVIQYVVSKYGQDQVANIVTFGTMAARNAVRDVARVLKMSYLQADQLAKMLPAPVFGRNIPLEKALESEQALKQKYQSDSQIRKVFDLALQLEGTIRNHGVHAAGVVISPTPMVNYAPLEITNKGVVTTQYAMNPLEDLGLLKLDFLGLSNLTILKNALRIIKKVYKQTIDIDNLNLEDGAVYKLLSEADTTGVFQLDSRGMRQYLRQLKPSNFEDVAVVLALYRPGPLTAGLSEKFVNRRHGKEASQVIHPAFEPILASTNGVLVYQEQVMQISRVICGFSGMKADELRKAIGKKKRKIMAQLKKEFIEGGIKISQIKKDVMEKVWQEIVGFADYAFNRSHSIAYGLIAYQTAYLKTHFRAAFMAAVMTSHAHDPSYLKTAITECNQTGIEVLAPDINESFPEFGIVPVDDKNKLVPIRFGLEAIKHASSKAIQRLVDIRSESGSYKSFDDFLQRQTDNPSLNRKTMESLIKSGVFDSLIERGKLLAKIDDIMDILSSINQVSDKNQITLFDALPSSEQQQLVDFGFDYVQPMIISDLERLEWERDLLGIYISEHPLDIHQSTLSDLNLKSLASLDANQDQVNDGSRFQVGGIIIHLKSATAKISRKKMAIIDFEDQTGSLELVVFPSLFEKYQAFWSEGQVLVLTLKAHTYDAQGNSLMKPSWTIEEVRSLS